MLNTYLDGYDDILDVVDMLLTEFPSNADGERGFSDVNNIKTKKRNCLKGTTLNKLMGVKHLTADVGSWNPEGNWKHVLYIDIEQ